MSVKVFVKDNSWNDWTEIGTAADVELTQTPLVPTGRLDSKFRPMASPSPSTLDIQIQLEGWKIPMPLLPAPPPLVPNSLDDMATLLAAVVRMMGGSVTVQPSDLEEASKCMLTNYRMQDPSALVIVVEEHQ